MPDICKRVSYEVTHKSRTVHHHINKILQYIKYAEITGGFKEHISLRINHTSEITLLIIAVRARYQTRKGI